MAKINNDKRRNFWDNILKGPPILSDEEAEDMIKFVKELRKEKGFRYGYNKFER
jgi:hypothetical protein